ncbi:MAG: phosphatidylinositol-specific phospholipase C/glycerophosphodiester phosphodiesterase family protein [Amphiplicatus sp.]
MQIIVHRRNRRAELAAVPAEYGVEIDLRSEGGRLILHHDPFAAGEDFEDWLTAFRHKTLILNVKEEGLEARLLDLMAARGIEDFFFLDQSFPFLLKTAKTGERRCAVRVSEFESLDTALRLAGRIDWVWVDCFTRFPLTRREGARLAEAGFKLCLVSPELQGRTDPAEIAGLRETIAREAIAVAAVCTKRPNLWGG